MDFLSVGDVQINSVGVKALKVKNEAVNLWENDHVLQKVSPGS